MSLLQQDIKYNILELKHDMVCFELRLDNKLAILKNDLIKWSFGIVFGAGVAQVSMMAAIVKLVH